jgi:two-component system, OmpR family, response regulator
MRILVAEDDPGLRSVLERGLRQHGYTVDAVHNGRDAVAHLRAYDYEAAVLDWRMPVLDGLGVIREVRTLGIATPILMLTARDTTADRIAGLGEGADDYLVKPFAFAELVARLQALQRRPALRLSPQLRCGDLVLDPAARTVDAAAGPLSLTQTEFGILEVLLRRRPAVVSRSSIAVQVWDEEADAVGSNTIDVHIGRLRAKLAGTAVRIETVRGAGYRVLGPEEPS